MIEKHNIEYQISESARVMQQDKSAHGHICVSVDVINEGKNKALSFKTQLKMKTEHNNAQFCVLILVALCGNSGNMLFTERLQSACTKAAF